MSVPLDSRRGLSARASEIIGLERWLGLMEEGADLSLTVKVLDDFFITFGHLCKKLFESVVDTSERSDGNLLDKSLSGFRGICVIVRLLLSIDENNHKARRKIDQIFDGVHISRGDKTHPFAQRL